MGQPAGRLHAACRRAAAAGGRRAHARPARRRHAASRWKATPGLLARELIGSRSYKSDDKAKQTPERLIARKDLITALEQGKRGWAAPEGHARAARRAGGDASGDSLDAVLCLMQAAWAAQQGAPHYGLPADLDPLEGWIVSA
jgi:hypothetical protein